MGVSGNKACSESETTISAQKIKKQNKKPTDFSLKLPKSKYPAPISLYPEKHSTIFFFNPAKIYSQFKSWKLHTGIIILVNQGESLFCFKTSHARKDLRNFILA